MKDILNKIQSNKKILAVGVVLILSMIVGVTILGQLQAQAQQTGEEMTDKLSNVVRITNVLVENDTQPQGEINKIHFHVRLASGSEDIDLQDATYTLSSIENETKTKTQSFDLSDNSVTIDGPQVLSEQKDKTTVTLNLDETDFGTISESGKVEIHIENPDGGTTYAERSIPSQIDTNTTYIAE